MAKHNLGTSLATLALAAATLGQVVPANAAYLLTEVSRPGAFSTALWDVNNMGVMVGYSTPGPGPTDFAAAFIYDGATFTGLTGPAGAISSVATGISDGGVVVGSYFNDVDPGGLPGPTHGFIYLGGIYTIFDVAGATNTFLRGISPDERYLSGYYSTATQLGVGFVYDTFAGLMHIVSRPDSLLTIAQGVNNGAILVGSDVISGSPTTRPGFFYDIATGTRTDVAIAGATRTALRSIDEAGIVAGWFADAGGAQHGFVGSVASFEQIDFAGADGTAVEGSNNARVLVGEYFVRDIPHAFIATPVPEPATWALLSVALAGLIGTRMRRRRASAVSARAS